MVFLKEFIYLCMFKVQNLSKKDKKKKFHVQVIQFFKKMLKIMGFQRKLLLKKFT